MSFEPDISPSKRRRAEGTGSRAAAPRPDMSRFLFIALLTISISIVLGFDVFSISLMNRTEVSVQRLLAFSMYLIPVSILASTAKSNRQLLIALSLNAVALLALPAFLVVDDIESAAVLFPRRAVVIGILVLPKRIATGRTLGP